MKAVRIHSYGGREVLAYEEAPEPVVGKDEVLIQVKATSVNPFDWSVRNGYLTAFYQYPFPHILGLDVSGVVIAVGSEVDAFAPGDAVYARSHPSRNGAYAEQISLPATQIAQKPASLDFLQAASVPHAATTAWRSLVDVGKLTAGQRVLIHGAAGGVGTFAVQLAKNFGAHVIGTSSENNLEFLRTLGADEVIDYHTVRFENVVHDMDMVLDLVGDNGDNTQQRSWEALKAGGLLASTVQFPSLETAAARGVNGQMIMADVCDTDILNGICELIESGKIHPVISTVFPLTEIGQAHELSEGRHVRGKIVVEM